MDQWRTAPKLKMVIYCHYDYLRFSIKVRPLQQGGMTRLWDKLFLDIKPEPSLWISSGTP